MIFVVGTGRSGTSTVARILGELGYDMGESSPGWPMPRLNIGDTYEDSDFSRLNAAGLAGELDARAMGRALDQLGTQRVEPWGAKCPAIADFLPVYRKAFPRARWVWCYRPHALVLRSLMRVRPEIPPAEHKAMIERRLEALELELPENERTLTMHFTEHRTDAFIADRLRLWLESEG